MKSITRTVKTATEMLQLCQFLQQLTKYPVTVTVKPGSEPRSNKQNRLFWQWMSDLEAQGDQTSQEYRAYCKLHFGIPILRAESPEFREQYERLIRHRFDYAEKLALMVEPHDYPVTRIMTVKQEKLMLDKIWNHFTGLGLVLTDPGSLGLEQRYGEAA